MGMVSIELRLVFVLEGGEFIWYENLVKKYETLFQGQLLEYRLINLDWYKNEIL